MANKDRKFLVYKSSAGSGKTYTLVREFLTLSLSSKQPDRYKNILAITFTNKAAAEMKERVIDYLKAFSSNKNLQGGEKLMFDFLLDQLNVNSDALMERSSNMLSSVLHSYSDFNITTIDKFILKIVRSFSFDLQLPYNFEVELDGKSLLTKAINNLLAEAGKDKQLTAFLVNYVTNLAENEENWKFQDSLLKISELSLNESNQEALNKLKNIPLSSFAKTREKVGKSIKEYQEYIDHRMHQGQQLFIENNIEPDDLSGKSKSSLWAYFNKKNKQHWYEKTASDTNWKHIESGEWTPKGSKFSVPENIQSSISQLFQGIEAKKRDDLQSYKLNKDVFKHLFQLGLINEIEKYVEQIREEQNFIHISEFNKKVAEIVTEQPIPFVYERIGEHFKNFLIDEFQDTSILQWQNLLPLIDNSLANGGKNLIVGDAKQAIYRWRGGDVDQFTNLPESTHFKDIPLIEERMLSLKRNYNPLVLNKNYRSSKEIIEFNNLFFKSLLDELPDFFKPYYEDFKQEIGSDKSNGYASIKFFEKENLEEDILDEIDYQINDCLERGWNLKDIAILSRKNQELSTIAEYLTKKNIPVYSSESLNVSQSQEVNFLISCFKLLDDRYNVEAGLGICSYLKDKIDLDLFDIFNDKNNFYPSLNQAVKKSVSGGFPSISGLSLYEIFEVIIETFQISKNDPFVLTFLDFCLNQNNQSNHLEFLELWDTQKSKLNISSPDNLNAVSLMTIHKSKGLEFPIVIYPFANKSKGNLSSWLWLNTEKDDTKLPISLVKNNKYLEETDYSNLSTIENKKGLLDDLNVLYVALTRPKNELYILAEQIKKNPDQIAGPQHFLTPVLSYLNSKQTNEFFYGSKKSFESNKLKASNNTIDEIKTGNWKSKIKMSYSAPQIWDVPLNSNEPFNSVNPRKFGNIIHNVFSNITDLSSYQTAIEEELLAGKISPLEADEVTSIVEKTIHLPQLVSIWDKGKHIVEKEILTSSGSSYRPDRVIVCKDNTYLIDFKTGLPKNNDKKQILFYRKLLQELGYSSLLCYLVYCNQQEIVQL